MNRRQQILSYRRRSTSRRAPSAIRQGAVQTRPRANRRTPLPFDSQAERESAELGNEAADTRASLRSSFQQSQEESGLGEGASNPYSHAAQLARERDAAQRLSGVGNRLYAGSTVNKLRYAAGHYDEGMKQLEAGQDRAQADYLRGTGQTNRDYQLGISKIKEGAINRALATEPAPLAPGRRRAPARRTARRSIQGRRRGI